MCPVTSWLGEKRSYPAVQRRADMEISSPMNIHGRKGSKGTEEDGVGEEEKDKGGVGIR